MSEELREKNVQNLLETLSKKETQKSIEALSKIDKDEWGAMATTTQTLKDFVTLGGTSALVTTLTSSVEKTIKLQIESILSPLTNEINQQITDILTPFISDVLTPIINDLNTFLSENQTGAGIGGIIGGVAGLFLPGSPIIGVIVGALIGALIESGYTAISDLIEGAPSGVPYAPDMRALYEAETGNTFTSIFDWQYIAWFNNRPTGGDSLDYTGGSDPVRRGGHQEENF